MIAVKVAVGVAAGKVLVATGWAGSVETAPEVAVGTCVGGNVGDGVAVAGIGDAVTVGTNPRSPRPLNRPKMAWATGRA